MSLINKHIIKTLSKNLVSSVKNLLFFSFIFSTLCHGELLEHVKVQDGEFVNFKYQWKDHMESTQSLSFRLEKQQIFDKYREFGLYKPDLAQEYVNNTLRKHLRKEPLSGVLIRFIKQGNELVAQIKSPDEKKIIKAEQQLSTLQQRFYQEYLTSKYYQEFTTPDLITAIKPDHIRIAKESAEDLKHLKPMIMEKSSIKNIRRVTNYVLGFVQNIPYATLESRITSSGAGFNPPLKLLWEHQGDCDSKVTLTASLLRMLMPRIKMVMVFIDNHALIGIEDAALPDDVTVTYQESTYVLAEPTGPAVLALGAIAPDSERAVHSGRYTIEPFFGDFNDEENENLDSEQQFDDQLDQ